MDIHIGKWFTPSIGARVGYAGLQAKRLDLCRNALRQERRRRPVPGKKFGVMYLHADAMWNSRTP